MIFDCWTAYGPRPNKDVEERWTLNHLLADLDFYGIAGALVRHEQAYYDDPMQANRRLLHEIRDQRHRLFPCWTVLPHQAGDFPTPGNLIKMMIDENVRAVCMYPAHNGFPIHQQILGPLAEVFNARKTPVLTTITDLNTSYESAVTFCNLFRDCPVILGQASWSNWRLMMAIMDACPNARMECHLFQANRAVEYLAQRYGNHRVLFGSGLLIHSAGAARGFIDWSLLDENSISRFAGQNLIDLLGQGPKSTPPIPADADQIMIEARAGKPVSTAVIDAHCHVLDHGVNGGGVMYVMINGDLPHMLELTRRSGIDLTAMMSWCGTVSMDVETGNALIEKLVQIAPNEVLGVSSCDPSHQTADEIRSLCRRLHLDLGFRGMKPYYTNAISYADERYNPYWEFGNAHKLYALLHPNPSAGGINAVCDLAARYPDMTFFIAHAGGTWQLAREAKDVVLKYPNVMAELTLTPVPNGIIEWLCSAIGPDRVLFGTDAPMRDPRPQLGWCVYTRLNIEDKKKVLGRNFARILKRAMLPGHTLPDIVLKNE